jgi:hypothetical protein
VLCNVASNVVYWQSICFIFIYLFLKLQYLYNSNFVAVADHQATVQYKQRYGTAV